MNAKPGLDPRSLALMAAIGLLQVAIVALWLIDDATVAAWFVR